MKYFTLLYLVALHKEVQWLDLLIWPNWQKEMQCAVSTLKTVQHHTTDASHRLLMCEVFHFMMINVRICLLAWPLTTAAHLYRALAQAEHTRIRVAQRSTGDFVRELCSALARRQGSLGSLNICQRFSQPLWTPLIVIMGEFHQTVISRPLYKYSGIS